jgi:hypothetical protein
VHLNVLLRIPNFFEDLATVVQAGTLDIERVSKNWKAVATIEWDYWSMAMARIRKEDPYDYSQWEKLVRDMAALPEPVELGEKDSD